MHGLRYVQNIASKLIESSGWHNPNLEEQLLDFDRQLIEKTLVRAAVQICSR
ncbi:hypothetical protein OGZ01_09995 [Vibrio harveyi]|nr:hypothetical protein [Vibrio harveyi]